MTDQLKEALLKKSAALLIVDNQAYYMLRDMFSDDMATNFHAINQRIETFHSAIRSVLPVCNIAYDTDLSGKSPEFIARYNKALKPLFYDANTLRATEATGGRPIQSDLMHTHDPADHYYIKDKGDALADGVLLRWLQENNINSVLLAGGYAEACITATVQSCIAAKLATYPIMDLIFNHNPAATSEQLICDNDKIFRNNAFYEQATPVTSEQVIICIK